MAATGRMGTRRLFAALVLIVPFLVKIAEAQSNTTTELPTCAERCVIAALPSSGCNATDVPCLCTSVVFEYNTTACISTSCSITDAFAAQDYNEAACGIPSRNNSDTTKRVTWTLWTIALISVIGRFVYRHPRMNGHGYGLDDWTMLVCMIILIPQQALLSTMLDIGLGRDIWNVSSHNITTILYYFWISEYFYNFVMCLEKTSILLMYLRIWTVISSDSVKFRVICFTLLGVLVTTAVTMTIVITFQCTPIDYAWNRWDGEHEGHCINTMAMIYAGAGLNISYDLTVYCLPIPKLIKINISKRKKIGICLIFLCSLFATICSIVRLQFLVKFGTSANPTWYYNAPALWSAVECHVTAICACMPALAGVIERAWKKTFGSYLFSRSRSGPSDDPDSGGQRSLTRVVPRRQLFDDDDDALELSSLRSIAGSIGETRMNSVHVLPKDEGVYGKEWVEEVPPGRRTPASQQTERVERSWLEIEDSRER